MLKTPSRRTYAIRPVLTGTLALLVVASSQAASPRPYERIVVFGTSLSDSGNAFALVGGGNTPPDYDVDLFLVPSSPYAKGGHHVSNGATWVEQFARPLGLAGSVRPALLGSSPGATNYAVGAARAIDYAVTFDLADQVNAFLADFHGVASPGALYVVEMGSSDVRDALFAFLQGQNPGQILQDAATSIGQHIGSLYAVGARDFLVWNSPDIGLTPAVRALDAVLPGVATLASQYSIAFNALLDAAIFQLEQTLPGIHIERLHAFELLHGVVANPSAFGFDNVTTACITPGAPPFACQNPDEFLFWDGLHPTEAGHGLIAQEATSVFGPF